MTFLGWLKSLFVQQETTSQDGGPAVSYDRHVTKEWSRLNQAAHQLYDTWRMHGTPAQYLLRLQDILERLAVIQFYALVDQERDLLHVSRDLALLIADFAQYKEPTV